MASRRQVYADKGEILNVRNGESYSDFKEQLNGYTSNEIAILKELNNAVSNGLASECFKEVVINFKGKHMLIETFQGQVRSQIEDVQQKIGSTHEDQSKRYETELMKLELNKLESFKWLLECEKKNLETDKQEVLKEFMELCVQYGVTDAQRDD